MSVCKVRFHCGVSSNLQWSWFSQAIPVYGFSEQAALLSQSRSSSLENCCFESAKAERAVLNQWPRWQQSLSNKKQHSVSAPDYSEPADFVLRLNICRPPVALIALCCEWTWALCTTDRTTLTPRPVHSWRNNIDCVGGTCGTTHNLVLKLKIQTSFSER